MTRNLVFRPDPTPDPTRLDTVLVAAIRAGFDGVELLCELPIDGSIRANGSSVWDWRLADACKPPVRAVACRIASTDAARAAEEITGLARAAAAIRCECINLTIPPVAASVAGEGFPTYQDALNFAHRVLHDVRLDMEGFGTRLALEAGNGGSLLSPVELRELVESTNSWTSGVCLDVNRIARFAVPSDWVSTLAGKLHSVRIWTDQPGSGQIRQPGQAGAHAASVVSALSESGFDGLLILAGCKGPAHVLSAFSDADWASLFSDVRVLGPGKNREVRI